MSHHSQGFASASAVLSINSKRKGMTWQAVQDIVLERIQDGIWPEGELIPTECDLAAELGCARATVNRAMQALAESGVVERRRKVGTRVARHPRVQLVRSLLRRELEAAGQEYGYRLVFASEATPPADVAQAMLLRSGEELLLGRAIFFADGVPYCCEERWTNTFAAPGLTPDVLAEMSACEWLVGNVPLNRASLSIGVDTADGEFISPSLNLTENDPVLHLERVEWLNNMPVSLSRRYFPRDHRFQGQL
ncbi:GntR family transcriptional regulator [Paracoccus sp. CPCC 101403]|uniref:GntR family transcriptional regulator n=2 Tax=Paracoccus broussonetiae TaxID=3075834 RepID=A0ABU3E7Z9_9RHOB|nr:GntR family transcriptional regulator [Paracoccus sp. CPCC 101403]MDT1060346.1 GntR family transcriptional regulator [Paracoccus sp. CPCC 101403]